MMDEKKYIDRLQQLLTDAIKQNGKPFAALIVINDEIVAEAINETHLTKDPTAHAELLAIQRGYKHLTKDQLPHAILYASGEPCQMCVTAAQYAGISRIVYYYNIEELKTVYPYESTICSLEISKQKPNKLLKHIQKSSL
ncbi:deaminase [Solibacillus sp. FSL W7-1464]|uniref:nucleoside deaminase n=1 Tax=Solibacillus sp. FSL W7-1464 TaxID=2921706 RepID=UPI0030FA9F14